MAENEKTQTTDLKPVLDAIASLTKSMGEQAEALKALGANQKVMADTMAADKQAAADAAAAAAGGEKGKDGKKDGAAAAAAGTLNLTEAELEKRVNEAAAKLGLPLVEVPIKTIYAAGRVTHFHGVKDTLRVLRLVMSSPVWGQRLRSRK